MTEYEALKSEPVPRSDALCRRLASTIEPAWAFVAYGILCFFLANIPATSVTLVGLAVARAVAGPEPHPWLAYPFLLVWLLLYVGAWIAFGYWVRRRRAAAARLFREGQFAEATVESVSSETSGRAGPVTRAMARIESEGGGRVVTMTFGGHPPAVVRGLLFPVLAVSGYRYCAAFHEGVFTVATIG